jgi:hypothetical protein
MNRGVLLAVLSLVRELLLTHKKKMSIKTYDPTKEDESYKKQLVVDNRMCFIEVIDTAGQGNQLFYFS